MTHSPPPYVVVGIDGSRAALNAALWAVDEAASRDIPLRLVHANDPIGPPGRTTRTRQRLAAGEIAVRQAVTAIESTAKPAKIESRDPKSARTVAISGVASDVVAPWLWIRLVARANGSSPANSTSEELISLARREARSRWRTPRQCRAGA